ncbi:DUF4234 domain-containing protein [Gordonia insulae]|uniref:DUF4234 domain-containing protein n=1 Tax=Gordonia insulae TaxID=2420509 RepID=A0A3G8JRV1_9ACTN|nr:DUF4234 domain-containing protein [Gordonia insulae]AZG47202.1 hypothetical protein D7316_03810 [Gordonia insulae]
MSETPHVPASSSPEDQPPVFPADPPPVEQHVNGAVAPTSPPPMIPTAPVPVASGLAMKRRNPFAVWIGLPLITLGIYFYVWYYKIHKEMAEFDRRRQIPVAGPLLVMIFLFWTVIAPLISYHNAGARIRNAQTAAGLPATCSPTLCWVLAFVFGTNLLYMQFELNKVVDRYAGAPPHTTVPLFV